MSDVMSKKEVEVAVRSAMVGISGACSETAKAALQLATEILERKLQEKYNEFKSEKGAEISNITQPYAKPK